MKTVKLTASALHRIEYGDNSEHCSLVSYSNYHGLTRDTMPQSIMLVGGAIALKCDLTDRLYQSNGELVATYYSNPGLQEEIVIYHVLEGKDIK
jgi:hypothetical protein